MANNYAHPEGEQPIPPASLDWRPGEWNLTTVPPPANYGNMLPSYGFNKFYNLRRPSIPENEETAEDRNLKAWRDSNYRVPFDSRTEIGRPKFFQLQHLAFEFAFGFLFGCIPATIMRGPWVLRTYRRFRVNDRWKTFTWRQKFQVHRMVFKKFTRLPFIFGFFQGLLRGVFPTMPGYATPWLVGVFLFATRRFWRRATRPITYAQYKHAMPRNQGDIEWLKHRSLIGNETFDRIGERMRAFWLGFWPRFKSAAWIIFLIELFWVPNRHHHTVAQDMEHVGRTGFQILASPTFGPDPPEYTDRVLYKDPEPSPPLIDGATWQTAWLWENNDPRSGRPYVPDDRTFALPSLHPILESTPDQLLKYDYSAVHARDHTPAFQLGQQDWRSENALTGRHEPLIRLGALPDGRYIVQRICLETLIENTIKHDPAWIDPALQDIGANLLEKAAADEHVLAKLQTGELKHDPWEEAPHRPLIVKDWNRREEREADRMIAARTVTESGSLASPLWHWFEHTIYAWLSPNPPTYKIKDGPGGYENITPEEIEARRQYVMQVDPKDIAPENAAPAPAPSMFTVVGRLRRRMQEDAATKNISVEESRSRYSQSLKTSSL